MNAKYYFYVIPLFMLEIIIQLLFFWLAPDNACRWVVYAFATVMSVTHLTLVFLLAIKKGARRSVPSIVCGTMLILFLFTGGIIMLSTNATVRNATFLMLILSILYVAAMCLMVFSIEGDDAAPRQPEASRKPDGTFGQPYVRYVETASGLRTVRNARFTPEMPARGSAARRNGKQTPPLPIR